ncbi:MAG: hypothetical protein Tsb0020_28390 [Haliangiales bacterium]
MTKPPGKTGHQAQDKTAEVNPDALEPESDERRLAILEAALACFFQYGYSRTRMEDIARTAGISRPNLYNSFRNKEAIFIAASAQLMATSLRGVIDSLSKPGPAWARIAAAFETSVVAQIELMQQSGHANELLEAANALALPIVDRYHTRLIGLLAQTLEDADRDGSLALDRVGASAHAIADVVVMASQGFKAGEVSIPQYRQRLRVLLDLLAHATAKTD